MTIDEAIAQEIMFSKEDWHKRKEYHEQLVEWLEELKVIKDGSIPIIHGKAELELHDNAIRNKAIDDFVNSCKENTMCKTFGLRENDIEKIAEQLKAGESE